jgi:hypothetical protein
MRLPTVIDVVDQQPDHGPGHPPTATIRVVATLRRFLREGTPWRSLVATEDQPSGSTLRCCLAHLAKTGLLTKVHALLIGMLRGNSENFAVQEEHVVKFLQRYAPAQS